MIAPNEKKEAKTMKRTGILAALALSACLLLGALPASAAAAPQLEVTSQGPFTLSVEGERKVFKPLIRNIGDASMPDGSVTLTATLSPELIAVGVRGGNLFGSEVYSCAISPDTRTVTCTGPTTFGAGIPPGQDACTGTGFAPQCPIEIEVEASPGAGEVPATIDYEACGGGAPACASVTDLVDLYLPRPFGAKFGIATVNTPTTPSAPAFPGTDAFWAGTCEVSSAPVGPIPGGFGTRPAHVWKPVLDSNGTAVGFQAVPAPASAEHCIDFGKVRDRHPRFWYEDEAPAWRLAPLDQAGAHPDGSATMWFHRNPASPADPDGAVDNIYARLPPGFVGNPNALPKCTAEQFAHKPIHCPPSTQVGVIRLLIKGTSLGSGSTHGDLNEEVLAVYNLEPRQGNVAELGFPSASVENAITVRIVAKARTNDDFGVSAFATQIPAPLPLSAQSITLWGTPWAAAHDEWRVQEGGRPPSDESWVSSASEIGVRGLKPEDRIGYEPSWGPIRPFLSNPTECSGQELSTRLMTDSFQNPGAFTSEGDPLLPNPIDNSKPGWKVYDSPAPAVTGCEKVGFDPDITLDPTLQGAAANQATDSASGLDVELNIPQNNDLPFNAPPDGAPQVDVDQYLADAIDYFTSDQGLATSHLESTVVTLPEGMTLNPAAADGQGVCTQAQIGVTDTDSPVPPAIRFNNQPVACPDSSKVGEVVVETPLLDEADWPQGSVYLAAQGDNPFGSDFAIYIAVQSPNRNLIVKLAGKVAPDPQTGRLTTTFVQNPQLPFDTFRLRFVGGPRAPLATPTTCGTHTNVTQLAPYSDPGNPAVINDPFELSSSPAGGCPTTKAQRPLSIGFSAGSAELIAGAHSPFNVRLTRPDGNQEFDRVEVTTPEGLAAKLAGVPYCPEGSIAQAIARRATGDGRLEQASPSCSAASRVGTTTIGAGAGSQPFFVKGNVYLAGPYKGAPVSLAFIVPAVAGPFDLGVQVVRTALNVNPRTAQVTAVSDNIPQILRGVPLRLRDIRVDIDRPGFTLNPTDCSEQLVTGKVFGSHGAVTDVSNRFQVANCANLGFKPKMRFHLKGGTKRGKYPQFTATVWARPGDANIASVSAALPRSEFLANEHIRTVCTRPQFAADQCPKGAIYGQATAWSPLLDEPLRGPVYLRSSDNLLPDLVPDLRGPAHQPIKIELAGRTDSIRGGIRNTFDLVPDAPVSRFVLRMRGGKKGLLVNSRDICAKPYRAKVNMTAQNGRKLELKPKLRAQCGKKGKRGKKGKGRGPKRHR